MTSSIKRLRNRSPQRARSTRQSGQFSPAYLNPYAWYDANLGGSAAGITDSSLNARAAMTVGAGSNSPLWLPYTRPSVYLPGVGTNHASCPSTASLVGAGDKDVGAYYALTSWNAAAANQDLISKFGAAADRGWVIRVGATGYVTWIWSTDGTGTPSVVSTAPISAANGAGLWVRVVHDVDNGASGNDVKFYTSTDPESTDPASVSWTQLGATVTTAGVTSHFASTAPVRLGFSTGSPVDGFVRKGFVRSSIAGPLVAFFDADVCTQTGCTDAYGNVWSITRATTGRKPVVQSPAGGSAESLFLLGTDDWLDVPAAAIPPLDTYAAASSVVTVFRRWHNPGAAGHAVFTTKASVANAVLGFTQRLDTTAASTILGARAGDGGTQSDGYDTAGAVTLALGARGVWYTQVGNASPYVSSQANNGTAGTDNVRATVSTTSTAGAGRVGAYLGGTAPIDMEFRALLTFNRALTGAEIAQLVAYYGGGL